MPKESVASEEEEIRDQVAMFSYLFVSLNYVIE